MLRPRPQRPRQRQPAGRLLAVLLLFGTLAGCDVYRQIYKPSHDNLGTPADLGLDYRDLKIAMDDGVMLHAWLIPATVKAATTVDPTAPLILLFHGNATDLSHQLPMIRFLHDRGAAVFAYDYRGFGSSSGESTTAAGFYADARVILDWLENQGYPQEKTIYDGRSLGAAVALDLAIARPPAAVVLECAFTSLAAMSRRLRPFIYIHGGWAFLYGEFDNLAVIDRLSSPLYLIHGRRDRIVPYRMARQLFERAPQPKYFYLATTGEHCNDRPFTSPSYQSLWETLLTEVVMNSN